MDKGIDSINGTFEGIYRNGNNDRNIKHEIRQPVASFFTLFLLSAITSSSHLWRHSLTAFELYLLKDTNARYTDLTHGTLFATLSVPTILAAIVAIWIYGADGRHEKINIDWMSRKVKNLSEDEKHELKTSDDYDSLSVNEDESGESSESFRRYSCRNFVEYSKKSVRNRAIRFVFFFVLLEWFSQLVFVLVVYFEGKNIYLFICHSIAGFGGSITVILQRVLTVYYFYWCTTLAMTATVAVTTVAKIIGKILPHILTSLLVYENSFPSLKGNNVSNLFYVSADFDSCGGRYFFSSNKFLDRFLKTERHENYLSNRINENELNIDRLFQIRKMGLYNSILSNNGFKEEFFKRNKTTMKSQYNNENDKRYYVYAMFIVVLINFTSVAFAFRLVFIVKTLEDGYYFENWCLLNKIGMEKKSGKNCCNHQQFWKNDESIGEIQYISQNNENLYSDRTSIIPNIRNPFDSSSCCSEYHEVLSKSPDHFSSVESNISDQNLIKPEKPYSSTISSFWDEVLCATNKRDFNQQNFTQNGRNGARQSNYYNNFVTVNSNTHLLAEPISQIYHDVNDSQKQNNPCKSNNFLSNIFPPPHLSLGKEAKLVTGPPTVSFRKVSQSEKHSDTMKPYKLKIINSQEEHSLLCGPSEGHSQETPETEAGLFPLTDVPEFVFDEDLVDKIMAAHQKYMDDTNYQQTESKKHSTKELDYQSSASDLFDIKDFQKSKTVLDLPEEGSEVWRIWRRRFTSFEEDNESLNSCMLEEINNSDAISVNNGGVPGSKRDSYDIWERHKSELKSSKSLKFQKSINRSKKIFKTRLIIKRMKDYIWNSFFNLILNFFKNTTLTRFFVHLTILHGMVLSVLHTYITFSASIFYDSQTSELRSGLLSAVISISTFLVLPFVAYYLDKPFLFSSNAARDLSFDCSSNNDFTENLTQNNEDKLEYFSCFNNKTLRTAFLRSRLSVILFGSFLSSCGILLNILLIRDFMLFTNLCSFAIAVLIGISDGIIPPVFSALIANPCSIGDARDLGIGFGLVEIVTAITVSISTFVFGFISTSFESGKHEFGLISLFILSFLQCAYIVYLLCKSPSIRKQQ